MQKEDIEENKGSGELATETEGSVVSREGEWRQVSLREFQRKASKYVGKRIVLINGEGEKVFYCYPNEQETGGGANKKLDKLLDKEYNLATDEEYKGNFMEMYERVERIDKFISSQKY